MISIGTLLKTSWNIYKKHFLLFVGVVLPAIAVNIIFNILEIIPSSLPFIFVTVGNIAGFLLSILVGISLIYAVKEREKGITAKQALKKGWKRFFSYWWLTVLNVFIVMGGYLLFIIPGIIISVWFSVAAYVFVAEDRKGMTALFRSKHLVSGHWWGVLWRFSLLAVLGLLIFIPFMFLATGFGFNFEQIAMGEDNPRSTMTIPLIILSWLTTAFGTIYGYLLYENLRDLKRNVVFEEPKKSTKVKFLLVGAFGVIVPFLVLAITIIAILVSVLSGGDLPYK